MAGTYGLHPLPTSVTVDWAALRRAIRAGPPFDAPALSAASGVATTGWGAAQAEVRHVLYYDRARFMATAHVTSARPVVARAVFRCGRS